jgi:hypothetical protein
MMEAAEVQVFLEDPISICDTYEVRYWARGWVKKRKFRGKLLSRASNGYLEGNEEPRDIVDGVVLHGWLIAVAGDTSGCGWDTTFYFLTEPLPEGTKQFEVYQDGNESRAPIVDGPHEVTWWEPK